MYYLSNTTRRLHEQGKFVYRTEPSGLPVASFNTGLYTDNYEPIFGFLEENRDSDRQPWVLKAWIPASDFRMRPFGDAMPEAATYFEDPRDLLYDSRVPLNPRLDHIVDDNVDRYPEILRGNNHLRLNALAGAIDGAEARIRQNYKTAVPHWYWPGPTGPGHLQLLLPLRLVSDRPELALVVDRYEHEYIAYTVLPLDAAYKRARMVARPDADWLTPASHSPNTIIGDGTGRWTSRGDRCWVCSSETGCILTASNKVAFCRRAEHGTPVSLDGVCYWRHERS